MSEGARVIEKHFTDDNDRIGPDHKFSMNPKTWREMVDESNKLFNALGDGVKKLKRMSWTQLLSRDVLCILTKILERDRLLHRMMCSL